MNALLHILWPLALCLQAQANQGPPEYDAAVDNGAFGYYPTNTFATADGINEPHINFLEWSDQCADDLTYFLTPRGWGIGNPGPMLLDQYGGLLWAKHFDNKFGGQAYDFTVQQYQGEDYLTFWLGDDRVRGHGSGFYYMLNSSYDIVHKVGAANGQSADLHEFIITPEGTALMTMYEITPHDVTEFREFDSEKAEDQNPNYIWDCLFQEVSVETGDLVFEWRASEHLAINSTYHVIGPGGTNDDPFDWFHINSIQKDELGNYLISARYTHSIMYVHGKTGDILWTLGGKNNMFMDQSDGFGLNFAWQHDARFVPLDSFPNMYNAPKERSGYQTHLLTFFDNAAEDQHYDYGLEYSRGMLVEITYPTYGSGNVYRSASDSHEAPQAKREDETTEQRNAAKVAAINGTNTDYTVRVIKSYVSPKSIRSSSQGSVQVIPRDGQDPKVLVGFGLNAVFTEFDSNGTVLCDAHFGAVSSWERGDIQSYRAYKFPWVGRPETSPSVDISDDDAEIYVSWNGATEVDNWVLQCSQYDTTDEKSWADVVRVEREGFETSILIPSLSIKRSRFLRVIALDKSGRRLDYGVSATINRGLMANILPHMSNPLPEKVISIDPSTTLISIIAFLASGLIIYEAYRRYLSWRISHGGGPLRWRKGYAYKLLSEA